MSNRLEAIFEELRSAIFAAYAAVVERDRVVGVEHDRGQSALSGIDEILDGHPLASFSAAHLALLGLIVGLLAGGRSGGRDPTRFARPDPVTCQSMHLISRGRVGGLRARSPAPCGAMDQFVRRQRRVAERLLGADHVNPSKSP
jgi:hypothetical protein